MANSFLRSLLGASALSLAVVGTAGAGGLERGGYNIDLLFDPSQAALDSSFTYVMPERKVKNVVSPLNALGYSTTADDSESYWVPRVGAKVGWNDVDCMVDYSEPWGAHTAPGANWAGALSNVETKIDSENYAGTCSYKFNVGQGYFRVIGGAFYQELSGFKTDLFAPGISSPIPGTDLFGRVDLEGDGWGWRTGVAYEIPDIALRASLVYNSEVDLGDVTGRLRVGPSAAPGLLQDLPIYGNATMPDSLELKLQSGIAPGWLAFGSIKWTDWSDLDRVAICPTATKPLGGCFIGSGLEVTSLDLNYRDGWTISAGVGHSFNDQWSGAVQLTWDRGTSQGFGTQTDTWTLSGGASYKPTENVELRLGGALGILTSGESDPYVDPRTGETVGTASYEFGNDLVSAVQGALKVKF